MPSSHRNVTYTILHNLGRDFVKPPKGTHTEAKPREQKDRTLHDVTQSVYVPTKGLLSRILSGDRVIR